MLHETHHETDRASIPPRPPTRNRILWIVVAFAVVAALAVGGFLWLSGDDDAAPVTTAAATTVATTSGTTSPATSVPAVGPTSLVWRPAAAPPNGQVLAVTDGYLAAAYDGGDVQFWGSVDGDEWVLLGLVGTAFGPDDIVRELDSGPAGFVAGVFGPGPEFPERTNVVWASVDGATWHRTELTADIPPAPSEYIEQFLAVDEVMIGPDGFLAFGTGGLNPDLDRIAADFAPGFTGDDVYGVDAERRPDGAVLIVGYGDQEPVEIPFADLGVTEDDLTGILGEEGFAGPGFERFAWWSSDAFTWQPVELEGLPDEWLLIPMRPRTTADDGFYLFGPGPDPADPEGPGVMLGYQSEDGRSWREFVVDGPGEDWLRSITRFGDGFLALGEDVSGDGLWTSPDLVTWTRLDGDLMDAGEGVAFHMSEIDAGGLGLFANGFLSTEGPGVAMEPVIAKDGYEITLGETGAITIVDAASGDLVAVIDPETGTSDTVDFVEEEWGVSFIDTASSEPLVTLTWEEIGAAYEALAGELGIGMTPEPVLRFSSDGMTWTFDRHQDLFGEGGFAISGAAGADSAVAVVGTDIDLWTSESDPRTLPQTVIWIGTPG